MLKCRDRLIKMVPQFHYLNCLRKLQWLVYGGVGGDIFTGGYKPTKRTGGQQAWSKCYWNQWTPTKDSSSPLTSMRLGEDTDLIIFDSLGVSENGVYTPCKRPLEWGNDVQPDTLGFNWICRPQEFPIVFFKCCDHFNPFPSKITSLFSFNLPSGKLNITMENHHF